MTWTARRPDTVPDSGQLRWQDDPITEPDARNAVFVDHPRQLKKIPRAWAHLGDRHDRAILMLHESCDYLYALGGGYHAGVSVAVDHGNVGYA